MAEPWAKSVARQFATISTPEPELLALEEDELVDELLELEEDELLELDVEPLELELEPDFAPHAASQRRSQNNTKVRIEIPISFFRKPNTIFQVI
jgi:hypothetical protein